MTHGAAESDRQPPPFGALLQRYRAEAGLTQEQLATRAQLSRDAIAALESGKRHTPRAATVHLLADALALSGEAREALQAATLKGFAPGASAATRATAPMPAPRLLPAAAQPTALIDRADELETIHQRLVVEGARLVTLTGPAGVGKTRLALAAAAQLAGHFRDGATLVDLTPVREPPLVLNTLAHALGLIDTGQPPLPERLQEALRERELLLVLDNFEQVLPAAGLLADLLAGCPELRLLVTSRVPLHLRWEREVRVPPLRVPDLAAALPPLDELVRVPAVALFVERARARRADFVLTATQAPLVAQLAVHLDGLPLALELAAARLGALSLPTIARRLGDRLQLLRWEAPDVPERQQSLEAAVGWSYELLSPDQQRLFRCLGVFVGRVALDAIAAVVAARATESDGGDGDEGGTLEGLVSLAEKSLVLPGRPDDDADDPEPAFGMLETVREYAQEQLAQHGELAAAQRAHAHYFLALAERADPQLLSRDQRAWYLRLEREHDNLRAALRWLLDQDGPDGLAERAAGLRLAGALGYFWWARGYHAEGWRWLEEALSRAPAAADAADAPAADALAAADAVDAADAAVRIRALIPAGRLLTYGGDLDRARALLEEAWALAQQRQDAASMAQTLTYMGLRAVIAGDLADAARLLEEARGRWDGLDDPFHLGLTLHFLGAAAFAQGDYAPAEALEADALEGLVAAGETRLAGFVSCYLGVIVWLRGDLPRAVALVRAGLDASATLRDRWLLSFGARVAVALVGAHADPAQCARLLGAADALSQATGATLSLYERLPTYPSIAPLRQRLEREGWGAEYREGRTLPFGAVAAVALSLLEQVAQTLPPRDAGPESAQQLEPPTQPSKHPHRSPLSEREREVLRLVAQGRSSKVIGQQLFVSASTVNQHLTSVFRKLGVNSRAQAVAVATRRSLL